ncbi:hypothetical protein C9374_007791 [Naegleria lovaniensis]|uniref:Zn(2)-C6 fungal-type domain-containing protein n=1 Tax=Naegleria lovaniensis TaxID=51637 RepID=A0AA88KIR1_NAELO|nr:uncharacterized protein C9374_007791 [Naegleria lovaniensis]KAG2379153.1 hypothetical protein C9374_007791 [Naegleria lovaniensis]
MPLQAHRKQTSSSTKKLGDEDDPELNNDDEEFIPSHDEESEDEEEMNDGSDDVDQQNKTTSGQVIEVLQMYSPIACRECRKGHRKCDKALPICSNCKRKGKECVYPQAKRNRKAKAPTRVLMPVSDDKKTQQHDQTMVENKEEETEHHHEEKKQQKEKKKSPPTHHHTRGTLHLHESTSKDAKLHKGTKHTHEDVESEEEEEESAEPFVPSELSRPRDERQPAHKRIEMTTTVQPEESPLEKLKTYTLKEVLIMHQEKLAKKEAISDERKLSLVRDFCLYDSLVSFYILNNEEVDNKKSDTMLKKFLLCTLYKTFNIGGQKHTHHHHHHEPMHLFSHRPEPVQKGVHKTHHMQEHLHKPYPHLQVSTSLYGYGYSKEAELDTPTSISISTPSPQLAHLIGYDSDHLQQIVQQIENDSHIPHHTINEIDLALMFCIQGAAFERIGSRDISDELFLQAKRILKKFYKYLKDSSRVPMTYPVFHLMVAFAYLAQHLSFHKPALSRSYIDVVCKYLVANILSKEGQEQSLRIELPQHGWKTYRSSASWNSEEHVLHKLIANVHTLLFNHTPNNPSLSDMCELLAHLNEAHLSNVYSQFSLIFKFQKLTDSIDITEFLIKTLKQKMSHKAKFDGLPKSPKSDEFLYEYSYLHIHEEDEKRIRGIGNETSFWIDNYLSIPCTLLKNKLDSKISSALNAEPKISSEECYERLRLAKEFFLFGNSLIKSFVSAIGLNTALLTSLSIVECMAILISKIFDSNSGACEDPTCKSDHSEDNRFPKPNSSITVHSAYSIIDLTRNATFPYCSLVILPCITKALEVQLEELELLQSTALLNGVFGLYGSQDVLSSGLDDLPIVVGITEIPNHNIPRVKQYLKWGLEAINTLENIHGNVHKYDDLKERVRKILSTEQGDSSQQISVVPTYSIDPTAGFSSTIHKGNTTKMEPLESETPLLMEPSTPLMSLDLQLGSKDFNSSNNMIVTNNILSALALSNGNGNHPQNSSSSLMVDEVNPQENNE